MIPPSATPHRPARLVALAAVAALVAVQWGIDGGGRVDFRIYHRSIRSMDGGHLYDYGTNGWNFLYPPLAAIVLRPLTWLGESAAAHVWLVVSVALGLATFAAVASQVRFARLPPASRPLIVAACLWSVPAFLSFRMGQINPLVAALVAVDVVAVSRRHRFGGIATGIAAALKVTPLLVIALLFVGGRRREAARALTAFVAAGALAAALLPSETVTYWRHVVFGASEVGGVGNALNASVFSLTGLVTDAPAAQRLLWAVAALALATVAVRGARERWSDDVVGGFTVAMTLSYLVSPLTWVHHQWFVTVALLLWLDRARTWRDGLVVALGMFALFDPFGLGEHSMLHTVTLVGFGVLTVVALPTTSDFPAAPQVAQDGPPYPEKRGAHV